MIDSRARVELVVVNAVHVGVAVGRRELWEVEVEHVPVLEDAEGFVDSDQLAHEVLDLDYGRRISTEVWW